MKFPEELINAIIYFIILVTQNSFRRFINKLSGPLFCIVISDAT